MAQQGWLIPMMSGTSDGNTQGQWCFDSWRLESSGGFFPPVSVLGFGYLEDRTAVIRMPFVGIPCGSVSTLQWWPLNN